MRYEDVFILMYSVYSFNYKKYTQRLYGPQGGPLGQLERGTFQGRLLRGDRH